MNGGTVRSYTHDDFPELDFRTVGTVSFDIVFRALDLHHWLRKEENVWHGRCPLHAWGCDSAETFTADNERGWYDCSECEWKANGGNVSVFVSRYLGIIGQVRTEVWLLQFVESEREKVLKRFGDHIAHLNAVGRAETAKTYDREWFEEHARYEEFTRHAYYDRFIAHAGAAIQRVAIECDLQDARLSSKESISKLLAKHIWQELRKLSKKRTKTL